MYIKKNTKMFLTESQTYAVVTQKPKKIVFLSTYDTSGKVLRYKEQVTMEEMLAQKPEPLKRNKFPWE